MSHSIFTDRNTPLGRAWAAGTQASKLKRSEILKANISKTCRAIVDPTRGFALRQNANLMFGVTRLFGQQCDAVYKDGVHLHAEVRRAMTHTHGPTSTIGIDMPQGPPHRAQRAGSNASSIKGRTSDPSTMSPKRLWCCEGWDNDFLLGYGWEADSDTMANAGQNSSSGIASGDHVPLSALTTPAGSQDRFVSSQEKLTLPSYRHLAAQGSIDGDADSSLDGVGFILGDDGQYEDLNLGLDLDDDDLQQEQQQQNNETRPSTPGVARARDTGAVRSLQDGQLDMHDDYDPAMDFSLERNSPVNLARSPSLPPMDALLDESPTPKPPRKRSRRTRSFARGDKHMEMPTQHVLPPMSCWDLTKQLARKRAQAAYDSAVKQVQKQPTVSYTSLVVGDETVNAEVRRVYEAKKALNRRIIEGDSSPQSKRATPLDGQYTNEHAVLPVHAGEEQVDFINYGDDEVPLPNGAETGDMTTNSLEVGRGRSSSAFSPNSRFGGQQVMPWDATIGGVSDYSGSTRGDLTPQSRRSMLPPFPLNSTHASPQITASDLSKLLTSYQAGDGRASVSLEDSMRDKNESQLSRIEGPAEAAKFLELAKETARQIRPQPLFFSDLAPVTDTEPAVTARGFYHLLTLATNGKLAIEQKQGSGEIEIHIVDCPDEHDDESGDRDVQGAGEDHPQKHLGDDDAREEHSGDGQNHADEDGDQGAFDADQNEAANGHHEHVAGQAGEDQQGQDTDEDVAQATTSEGPSETTSEGT